AFRAHRVEAGKPASVDAAPAGGGYAPCALGRPWPTVRRHDDRLPAAPRSDGLHAAATKERWPLLRIGGLNTGPVAARKRGPKGFQDAAMWSAGRRLSPIARRKETPSHGVSGGFRRPLRSAIASAPRFPALRSPGWGA